ncbi:uncharacterized protein EI97DRAFT_459190 [Westerdykella ornata]|uniref:Uncharacterized protein n=1 Tax=Westerdykella ornata TaxID=318751 RepID=A0A6A6JI22_WESOR|nr:uncharacterized protein EI97DRAFT_459190 [Westerdykella ornata]KAF2275733.1 hypothetical protein EI97DRAFT_459190 [Westerdykella ornata]
MYPGSLAAILVVSTIMIGTIITYVGYSLYSRHLQKGNPRAQRTLDNIELYNLTLAPNSIPSRPVSRAPRVPPKAKSPSTASTPGHYSLRESQLSLGGSSVYSTTPGRTSNESGGTLRRHGEPPASTEKRTEYGNDDDDDAWTDVDMCSQSAVTTFDFGFGDESFEGEKRRSRPETALRGHGLSLTM